MLTEIKPKILFLAFHSITSLSHYFKRLEPKADCWWATFHPQVYAEIRESGCEKVFFENMLFRQFKPRILGKIFGKINVLYVYWTLKKRIARLIKMAKPDIIVTDTNRVLARYGPKGHAIMTVQVFHAVSYKKYFLQEDVLAYDLVLLPSSYHKERLCRYFKAADPEKFQVVGWPRVDNFFNGTFTQRDKDAFVKKFDLNPRQETVLYAPSWNTFYNKGLFPRSFGAREEVFDIFCKKIKELGVNLIIKFHPASHKLIYDTEVHRIAKKYDVCLAYKSSTECLESLVEHFLWSTDVLISDASGIINDFMVLDRPIVYVEPDARDFCWQENDLPKEFRAGIVVSSLEGLIEGVKRSLQNSQEYALKRKEIANKIFYKLDGLASQRASEEILRYYVLWRKIKRFVEA